MRRLLLALLFAACLAVGGCAPPEGDDGSTPAAPADGYEY